MARDVEVAALRRRERGRAPSRRRRSSTPHEIATMRGVAVAISRMFSSPSGVSVAIRVSRVAPFGNPVMLLEPVQDLDDRADVGRAAGLRDHVAVGACRDRLLEVRLAEPGGDRIHPHPALAAAEVAAEPLPDHAAGRRLAVRRDRVLEVEDQAVGRDGQRLGEHAVVAARHEVERAAPAAHDQAPFLRIIALRRATITTSPFWLSARCTNVTMPHCGRERDSRLSTTSVSE